MVRVAAVSGRATLWPATMLLVIAAVSFNPQILAMAAGVFLVLFLLKLDRLH